MTRVQGEAGSQSGAPAEVLAMPLITGVALLRYEGRSALQDIPAGAGDARRRHARCCGCGGSRPMRTPRALLDLRRLGREPTVLCHGLGSASLSLEVGRWLRQACCWQLLPVEPQHQPRVRSSVACRSGTDGHSVALLPAEPGGDGPLPAGGWTIPTPGSVFAAPSPLAILELAPARRLLAKRAHAPPPTHRTGLAGGPECFQNVSTRPHREASQQTVPPAELGPTNCGCGEQSHRLTYGARRSRSRSDGAPWNGMEPCALCHRQPPQPAGPCPTGATRPWRARDSDARTW